MSMRSEMHERAYALLKAGQRPTADALLAEFGGSKSTAVQALQEFWTTYLPPRLTEEAAASGDGPPQTAVNLATELWRRALEYAETQLEAKRAAAIAETESERAEIEAEREAMEDERQQLKEAAETAQREAAAARLAAQEAEANRKRVAAANATLEVRIEGLETALADRTAEARRLTEALESLGAEREILVEAHRNTLESLTKAHAERIEELRTLHVDTDARWRVELDAARTEVKQARLDAQKAREGWDGKLEAERLRGERALEAERGLHAVRLAEVREGLEGQISLLKQLVEQARSEAQKPVPVAQGEKSTQ
jgi:DNA repair exonuclease SbcCD ATPase subunit